MNKTMTERNAKFRERLIMTDPVVCPERAEIWTRVFKQNESMHPMEKAALALETVLNEMTVFIDDGELIAGNQGSSLRATTLNPAVNTWVIDELDKFENRKGSRFLITEETKERIRKIIPYWKGKTVYEKTLSMLEPSSIEAMNALVFTCGYTLTKGCGHWLLNIENVLKNGFESFERTAEKELAALDYTKGESLDKIPFYRSIIKTCRSVKAFAGRYSRLAKELAENAEPDRKAELEKISEICAKVPYKAPETFYEAVQTVFFVQLLTQIESDGTGISLGRLDNMLYPFYKKDIESGEITREKAEELLDRLWLKIASIIQIWNEEDSKAFGGHPISQAITLGGQDENGNDATNELSYMMLETTARVHMAQPSLCVRVNRNSPEDFLLLAAEVIREGMGMPAMYNDEIAVPSLVMRGVDIKDARRDYAVIGCVEMGVQGKLCAFANSGYFNLVKCLELTLNDGIDPVTGRRLSSATGGLESFGTYEELENAYMRQMEELLAHQASVTNVVDAMHARLAPLPFVSAITEGCLEKGTEVQSGGAKYNFDGIQGVGLADVADSLAAIKQLVYEEKSISAAELKKALSANFFGYDDMLVKLKKDVPKYGNNDAPADGIARRVVSEFCRIISEYTGSRGSRFIPGMYSNSANVPLGAVCGATPNGRRAFTPIAEACSPSHGSEKNGPTQAALSVAHLDHMLLTNGSQYNQKYHPSALKGMKGLVSLKDLILAFFEAGGYHIQFNVVDAETMRAAQREPEKHRDLVVRVAGYTAFFTDLDEEIQNDIIDRTELSFA